MKTKTILFAALACLCATQTSVAAVAKVWIGGESGDWNNAANWEVLSESSANSDYIFTNAVTFSNYSINASASAYVHLTNSTAALHFRKGGAHAVRRIYIKNGGSLHLWDKGCLEVDHSGGEIHCDKNSSITCYGENAIPPHLYKFNMTGTLDLGGYNQAITNVATFTYDTYGQVVKSDSPALLTIGGRVVDCNFTGYVRGAAGLCWNPDNSDRTLLFYNYESTTTGELIVSNGVVSMNTGSSRAYFSHLSRTVIGPTATLRIPYQVSILNFHTEHLVVHEGANLELGQNATVETCTVERVTFVVGGVTTELPAGVYGASSGYDWLTGSSFLRVRPTMSYWTAPQNGNWGEAANWSAGVPSSALGAGLVENGGDYTVTIAEPAVVTNLNIRNWGEGTTTLNVASRLESTKGLWNVGKGGRIVVPQGGEVEYRGVDATVTGGFARSVEAVKLSGGASLEVRGKMSITNMCGTLSIGEGESAVTSKVVIAGNGELYLRGTKDKCYFKMSPSGRIEVSDYGVLRFANLTEYYMWYQNGGTLDFSGHATFDAGGMWDICLGQGRAVFRDDAKMVGNASVGNGSARLYFSASAGAPTEVWFKDRAVYSAGSSGAHTLLRPNGGGRIVLRFDSEATHTFGYLKMGRTAYNGFVDMYISDGLLKVDSTAGFNQGGASVSCDANSFTTGHVYQTGGAFVVNGESGGYQSSLQYGFILGDGLTSTTVREPTVLGVYELSGGVVTNGQSNTPNSPFVLGVGRGRGEFIQTGGEFVSKTDSGRVNRAPAILGYSNGYGYYTLSNGTAKIDSKIWVGGVSPATCGFTHSSYTGTESVGGITVAAADKTKPCSFTVSNTAVLGGLGEGTLEVGPGGTFSGTDLVLSNNTASVLRLVADDSGFGAVNLSGKLTITDGASLVVDATGFTGSNARRCPLLSCASMSGSFAPGRVTVLTDNPTEVQVSVAADGIVLRKIAGTVILLR